MSSELYLGPSAGVTYKINPYVKGEVTLGAGYGVYAYGTLDNSQLSLTKGETLAVGGRASAQIGIQFGPYLLGLLTMEKTIR